MARGDDLAPPALTDERAWIDAQLTALDTRPAGPIEEVRARPWSMVLRVPTERGEWYFKASGPELRHEPAIAAYLAGHRPELVPPPLAIDAERGWMLMAAAGTSLRALAAEEHDVSRWLDVLPSYGQLQVDLAGATDDLLALGAPDLRLAVLPARFEALLDELDRDVVAGTDPVAVADLRRARGAIPRVAAMCEELARHGIAEAVQHDDLNDGAVYLDGGRYRILDWGDACISHPWFSMSVTLEGVIAWGPDDVEHSVDIAPYRDAYLVPFANGRDPRDLLTAFDVAVRLGWVCRAVNGHLPGIEAASTWIRLRMFLDGHT